MAKKHKQDAAKSASTVVDLNVMPFIDVFSLLTTFLMFSAVFFSVGMLEVQIPFLSNAEQKNEPPKRKLDLKAEVTKDKVILTSKYTLDPVDEKAEEFQRNKDGLAELNKALVSLKQSNKDSDLITVFIDDDVTYEGVTEVIESLKSVLPSIQKSVGTDLTDLFPKVVMGSVIL